MTDMNRSLARRASRTAWPVWRRLLATLLASCTGGPELARADGAASRRLRAGPG